METFSRLNSIKRVPLNCRLIQCKDRIPGKCIGDSQADEDDGDDGIQCKWN